MGTTENTYDAIIIGGGHNGLVAAAYLARARWKVLLLERREVLGGAAATEEVFPGFNVNTGACDSGLFLPEIVSDLRLKKYGLQFLHSPVIVHAPQAGGGGLTLWRDPVQAAAEIARFSPADAARYPVFLGWMRRVLNVLREALNHTPPAIPDLGAGEIFPWLRTALKARRLGKKDFMELMRTLPMPLTDFLDEWFESPALKGALAASGVTGSMAGPNASGTVFMLLYQAAQADQATFRASSFVKGGMGALSETLAQAARDKGAEIRTGSEITKIAIEGDRASGVILNNGEEIQAKAILSSANPLHTFFDLVGAPNLEVRTMREVRNIRFRGSTARLNLALNGLPDFGLPEPETALSGHILICPSLEYMERAYDDAKYGKFSQHPVLDAVIPTLMDPGLAPSGQHLMNINIQYAPYHLQGTDWEEQHEALASRVIETLEEFAPRIGELVIHQQILTPLDLERIYGLAEGCIFHGQMAFDQLLFMRPVPGYGQYETPIRNLFLCGAGAHPGGGVTGAPGRNAARQVLKSR